MIDRTDAATGSLQHHQSAWGRTALRVVAGGPAGGCRFCGRARSVRRGTGADPCASGRHGDQVAARLYRPYRTVPLGAQPWSVDPFAADIADGKLYGRGSSDMKSGVAAFVTACMANADRLANTPGVLLVIIAGVHKISTLQRLECVGWRRTMQLDRSVVGH
ncbi:MAG: M20/M25/M40 family metallo-hydrolase [Xanthobacteraceae bacterium]|nr:M20/M25/M40 family metallo-hydrolase [Xanthobacteraceae bacterium]